MLKTSFKKLAILFTGALVFASCSSDDGEEIDEERPEITVAYENGFPTSCAELKRGETYTFRARVTDNLALAAYSLNVHHNFDHHTHDDQGSLCELEPIKEAQSPFIYLENFSIAENPQTYEISIPVTIPETVDLGDYHTAFSVTDQTGWQSRTSIDIKIIE
ncbi:DUF4625 domain-containing protein [Aequorivita echinoideorum]|uniref:DUF4625 domain-containing protein n=1 Tax=Aequorivita echinoideorum TaxID=1549647 RepID=A0ABS5S2F8_9FLAO|nr:DUF4625 domain-containing protein [Aequorivita echinoideorum]MBT0607378.1 DUF4625 domain-containing protein [Aequorivita echinoideorum]